MRISSAHGSSAVRLQGEMCEGRGEHAASALETREAPKGNGKDLPVQPVPDPRFQGEILSSRESSVDSGPKTCRED